MSEYICPEGTYIVDKEEYQKYPTKFKPMYEKLMAELNTDSRVDKIIFGWYENLGGNTIQILTTRGTQWNPGIVFEKDYSNDMEVIYTSLAKWSQLPPIESEKEQYEGIFKENGKKIKFNRQWGNYRFDNKECKALLDGEHISFEAVNNAGELKTYCGILAEQEYNGFRYFGFKLDGYSLPREYYHHKFTPDEYKALLNGEEIFIKGFYSDKKKKTFNAYIRYSMKEGIKFNFKNKSSIDYYFDSITGKPM